MSKIQETIKGIKPIDESFFDLAQKRLDNLTKPQGSLGRLEEFARKIVAITENIDPVINKKVIFTFAGDHGVVEEGVSAFPKEVTLQMVLNFLRGGAGINVLARHAGCEVKVIDIGVDYDFGNVDGLIQKKVVRGTKNIRRTTAMTRQDAVKCIEVGIDLADEYAKKGYHIFGTGDMGIGNTTSSSAIIAVFSNRPVEDVTGRGTGIGDAAFQNKVNVIEDAILANKPNPKDPIDVLAKVGGAEIGGICGLILGACKNRIPVIADGFISTAGVLIAYELEHKVKDYMFAAHNSVEKGHKVMLDIIGLRPIIDLDLRLGEGTGAALAISLIEAGVKIYKEMATFSDAGVSENIEKAEI